MTRPFWNIIKFSPVVFAATLLTTNAAIAAEVNQEVTSVAQLSKESDSLSQVTSVSQFSDVQPTDWAFQALQSLVERYGCIAGYPNGTYRGQRAMTRYEFAAGLNACLDRVNELIATATADLVKKEDLATLQRLQEEFAAELATLRGRVDALEARTAELEANQFSTTTKLVGEAIFSVAAPFGDEKAVAPGAVPGSAGKVDDNITFSNRVRLRLNSSFTGKDQLQIRLQARNTTQFDGGSATAGRPNITGTSMTRLSYDGDQQNDVFIDKINYAFNLSDSLRIKIDANSGEFYDNVNNFNPDLASDGRGSISRYGRFSPIYRVGQGGAGITATFNPKGTFSASVGYLAGGNNNVANDPRDGRGLFDGNYALLAQLAFQPGKAFNVGLAYARTYQNAAGGVNVFESTGSGFASRPFGNVATSANHYGLQANFKASDKLGVGGWIGFADIQSESGPDLDANAFYWMVNAAFKDIGPKGSLLGLQFGQPPRITDNDVAAREDNDTSYHLEALYRLQMTDNISVTPGLLVIFNPEHNDNNDTIYVGTLRTTFTF
ncbi:iron uptake porin [Calothrix sp. 336/3]|uniref:iron uptake porin n=1 Tax=Calothrix sp. 336/3 TaxID=1337936 RepID=UPI0004E28F6A|nr:iron uptake porin [Calothrix sp. 336/3]AKG23409.1 membrane protein [Calothrix sp. 336/3]